VVFNGFGSLSVAETAGTGVTPSAATAGEALRECVALAARERRAGSGEAGEISAFDLFEFILNILA
jgi:hypothetical protein